MSINRRQKRAAARDGGLRVLDETPVEIIYTTKFNGHDIRLMKNKLTGQVMTNMEDMAIACGKSPEDVHKWLSSDEGLDAVSEAQKNHPGQIIIDKRS